MNHKWDNFFKKNHGAWHHILHAPLEQVLENFWKLLLEISVLENFFLKWEVWLCLFLYYSSSKWRSGWCRLHRIHVRQHNLGSCWMSLPLVLDSIFSNTPIFFDIIFSWTPVLWRVLQNNCCLSVCPFVCPSGIFIRNGSLAFSDFLHDCR